MKQYKLASITFAAFLTLTSLALVLFGLSAPSSAHAKPQQTRGAYRAQLDALLSENNTPCKSDDDCEAIGVGTKPCGGPSEFVLVSKATRSKSGSNIDDVVKMIGAMDTETNALEGTMGTCVVMKKPELACASGTCKEAAKAAPAAKK
ncbi:hypothetical protein BH10BDE1_BH10BDE1_04260 [soil metagenome]